MGQAITVTIHPGVRGDVGNFELDGFLAATDAPLHGGRESARSRPPDELARRFRASGFGGESFQLGDSGPDRPLAASGPEVEDAIVTLHPLPASLQRPAPAPRSGRRRRLR